MSLEPVEKLARMEEIADLLYLESAPFANGEIVHVDGGSARREVVVQIN
jgi:hypothetical protein